MGSRWVRTGRKEVGGAKRWWCRRFGCQVGLGQPPSLNLASARCTTTIFPIHRHAKFSQRSLLTVLGRRLVEEARLVAEELVDGLDGARDGSVNVRSGLDRLDGADGLCGCGQLLRGCRKLSAESVDAAGRRSAWTVRSMTRHSGWKKSRQPVASVTTDGRWARLPDSPPASTSVPSAGSSTKTTSPRAFCA